MSLRVGYLTSKQKLIWSLKTTGLHEAGIARKLSISRQTVHKALNTANSKILESLKEAAEINKIEIETVDSGKGFLVGYSSHFKTRAFITFSAKNGVQVWYKHEGNCKKCRRLLTCRENLIEEARERNLPLPNAVNQVLPSKLADELFAKITGET